MVTLADLSTPLPRRLIAGDKVRISDLRELQTLPFFSSLPFSNLRETQAPFVPALESECDVGYYDDFTNQEDLAKYGESRSSLSLLRCCLLTGTDCFVGRHRRGV